MAARWTDAQLDAIRARHGTVLVSAAAGSGKTAVLVERVIERLTDPDHPTDADRLLVVTFTKAAAAEMRERLGALIGGVADRMWVSTFHSACVRILRRDGEKIGLKSGFTIYDTADC